MTINSLTLADLRATSATNSTPSAPSSTTPPPPSAALKSGGDFSDLLKTIQQGGKKEVNEEELFAAIIGERLSKLSKEAGEFYAAEKERIAKGKTRSDGYVPLEDVAKEALQSTLEAGKIKQEDADRVFSHSFAAAQLDDNKEALYDGRGGPNDPTIATASTDSAIASMKAILTKIDSGELSVSTRSMLPQKSDRVEGGVKPLDGKGGFVWKPESDRDGKLAVLLPSHYAELIDRVEIHSKNPPDETSKVAAGAFSGNTNGNRPTYRFDKPGGEYGEDLYLVAYPKVGDPVLYAIPNGGERQD